MTDQSRVLTRCVVVRTAALPAGNSAASIFIPERSSSWTIPPPSHWTVLDRVRWKLVVSLNGCGNQIRVWPEGFNTLTLVVTSYVRHFGTATDCARRACVSMPTAGATIAVRRRKSRRFIYPPCNTCRAQKRQPTEAARLHDRCNLNAKSSKPALQHGAKPVAIQGDPCTVEVFQHGNGMFSREAREGLEAADVEGLSSMLPKIRFDLCQCVGVDEQVVGSHADELARPNQHGNERWKVFRWNPKCGSDFAHQRRCQARSPVESFNLCQDVRLRSSCGAIRYHRNLGANQAHQLAIHQSLDCKTKDPLLQPCFWLQLGARDGARLALHQFVQEQLGCINENIRPQKTVHLYTFYLDPDQLMCRQGGRGISANHLVIEPGLLLQGSEADSLDPRRRTRPRICCSGDAFCIDLSHSRASAFLKPGRGWASITRPPPMISAGERCRNTKRSPGTNSIGPLSLRRARRGPSAACSPVSYKSTVAKVSEANACMPSLARCLSGLAPGKTVSSTSTVLLEESESGGTIVSPRPTSPTSIPVRFKATRPGARVSVTALLCTWIPRTLTTRPLGCSSTAALACSMPLCNVPVTTVPKPRIEKERSKGSRRMDSVLCAGILRATWYRACLSSTKPSRVRRRQRPRARSRGRCPAQMRGPDPGIAQDVRGWPHPAW